MDTVPVRDMSPRSPRLGTPDSGWDDDDDLDLGLGNKIYSLKKLELVFFINERRNSIWCRHPNALLMSIIPPFKA